MERKRLGPFVAAIGTILLIVSLFLLLPLDYILSLLLMFCSVILIGIGVAFAKGVDKTLDTPEDTCYYCQGSGKILSGDVEEVCPRCGGTGLAREND